jgi:hypothetical protein
MKALLLVPSTYGLIGWGIAAIFLFVDPVGMNSLSINGYLIFVYTILVFAIATIFFNNRFAKISYKSPLKPTRTDITVFFCSTVLGITGLYLYLHDILTFYGNISALAVLLTTGALQIRSDAEEFSSFAVQLSYFSWISIFAGLLIVRSKHISGKYILLVCLLIIFQFSINLLFIDRTRPVWILFTIGMGMLFSRPLLLRALRRGIAYIIVAPAVIFVVFSFTAQKFNEDYGIFGTMAAYIISGPGYIDDLSNKPIDDPDYFPKRTFFPIAKALHSAGLVSEIPDHVLIDRHIPFATNVGTMHEPYFSDGGFLYFFFAFPTLVFAINYLAYFSYKSRSMTGLFLWSNCTFLFVISFFVPKFNSVPFYLFILIFITQHVLSKIRLIDTKNLH